MIVQIETEYTTHHIEVGVIWIITLVIPKTRYLQGFFGVSLL